MLDVKLFVGKMSAELQPNLGLERPAMRDREWFDQWFDEATPEMVQRHTRSVTFQDSLRFDKAPLAVE